ncbi:MAG TPA: iron permease, partial [Methylocystis sp.]|nr:iron permease [Methylocystis sp.]
SRLAQTLWDTSAVLPDNSLVGRVLHTLIGYTDQPSLLQALVYALTIVVIVAATRFAAPSRKRAPIAAAAAP